MAEQLNVTKVGAIVEMQGHALVVTKVGAIVEFEWSRLMVTAVGAIVELEPLPVAPGGRKYGPAVQMM